MSEELQSSDHLASKRERQMLVKLGDWKAILSELISDCKDYNPTKLRKLHYNENAIKFWVKHYNDCVREDQN